MRVFVSCAPADRGLAEQLTAQLSGAGLQVWFDGDISGDEQWWRRCAEAVEAGDAVVAVWTPHLAAAKPAMALVHYGAALGRAVVAVRAGQVDGSPAGFGPTARVLEFGDPALASTVQALGQQTGPWPQTSVPPPPWPFGYLPSLRATAAAPVLPAHEQHRLVAGLHAVAVEDGQYPAVAQAVTELAGWLRARPDLDPGLRPQVDALLPYAAPQQYWPSPPPGYGHPPGYGPPAPANRGRTIAIVSAVAVVAIIALVVGVVLLARGGGDGSAGPSTAAPDSSAPGADGPAVRLVDDGIVVGSSDAPVTVDVFNDAMCPSCGRFITTYTGDMQAAVQDNDIRVHYHLINMLDGFSASGDYSSRAAAAVYCVAADSDVPTFEDFYVALFDPSFQPEEGGTRDHTDDDLADLAADVGVSDSAVECISSGGDSDAEQRTEAAYAALEELGGAGVPSVYSDGVEVDITDPGWVAALIR